MDYVENKNDLIEWIDCNIYGLTYSMEKIKLISLISEVLERLPLEDRQIIMYQRGVRFIAPITVNCVTEHVYIDPIGVGSEQNALCRCSKCNELHFSAKSGNYDMMVGIWLVCLSSDILERSKEESLFTIAHELAHVYLEIPKTASMIEGFTEKDKKVNEQVIRWNFKSKLRQKQFNHISGGGRIQNVSSVDAI